MLHVVGGSGLLWVLLFLQVARESLRWKRGRIIGKGAYGKVWEGLMDSGKIIAVKEVELDYTSIEKAQSVSVVCGSV